MRIVILSTHSPFPPNNGGRIRLGSLVKALSGHHDVRLVLLTEETEENLDRVRASGVSVNRVRYPAWDRLRLGQRLRHNVTALLRGTTPLFESVDSVQTRATISRAASDADALILDTTSLAPFASWIRERVPSVKILINTHDIDSDLFARLAATGDPLRALQKRLLAANSARLEGSFHRHADAVLVVSAEDKQKFERHNRARIPVFVVPNAVDTDQLRPLPAVRDPTVIFCGTLNYDPNVEAIRWFIVRAFPSVKAQVPNVRLLLVGRSPTAEILDYATDPSVEVVGEVDDVRASYARSAIAIAPLLRGGGTRLKILEAMALGRAVVSTSVGAGGLDSVDGLFLADTPDTFAGQVVKLLQEGAPRALIEANIDYVQSNYSWRAIAARLDDSLGVQRLRPPG